MTARRKPRAARTPSAARETSVLTANDVAKACGVDLKTIHNWCGKGKIPHARTTGGHLRFRRLDVIDFLRAYGYPVPERLRTARARVLVVGHGVDAAALRRALRKTEIVEVVEPFDALVELCAIDPEIVVLGADVDTERWLERLAKNEKTRHLRVVAGRDGVAALRDAIERIVEPRAATS